MKFHVNFDETFVIDFPQNFQNVLQFSSIRYKDIHPKDRQEYLWANRKSFNDVFQISNIAKNIVKSNHQSHKINNGQNDGPKSDDEARKRLLIVQWKSYKFIKRKKEIDELFKFHLLVLFVQLLEAKWTLEFKFLNYLNIILKLII